MQAISAYYAADREHDRLSRGLGMVEFARTLDILARTLPPVPATVLDIGGGTGAYARELLQRGYAVHFLDAMPGHIQRVQADPELNTLASVTLGDARALPYPDACADVALLLGPLYHLQQAADRAAALAEAQRTLKPGGVMVAAMIPRAAMIFGDFSRDLPDETYCRPMREHTYRTGHQNNPEGRRGYFTEAYFHHPDEFRAELGQAGFGQAELYAVEGPAGMLSDVEALMNDPVRREGVMSACRLLEQDAGIFGYSPHVLGVAVKL